MVSPTRRERGRLWNGVVHWFVLLLLGPGWARAAEGENGAGEYCGLYCVYGSLQAIGKGVPFETLLHPRYMSSWGGARSTNCGKR